MMRGWICACALTTSSACGATMVIGDNPEERASDSPASPSPGESLAPSPNPHRADASQLQVLAGRPGGFGTADDIGTDARFRAPNALAIDDNGHAFIGEPAYGTEPGAIRMYDVATRRVSTLARGMNPGCLVWLGDRLYYAARGADAALYALDPRGGAPQIAAGSPQEAGLVDGELGAARFGHIRSMARIPGTRRIVVAERTLLREVDFESRQVRTIAGTEATGAADGKGASARFRSIYAMACNEQRICLLQDGGGLRQVDETTGDVTSLTVSVSNRTLTRYASRVPSFSAFEATNVPFVWLAATPTGVVRMQGSTHLQATAVAGVPVPEWTDVPQGDADGLDDDARFGSIAGLVRLPGTDLAFMTVDTDNATLKRIDAAPDLSGRHIASTVAGASPQRGATDGLTTNARFRSPENLSASGSMLFVTDGSTIRRFESATGTVDTLAGVDNAQFTGMAAFGTRVFVSVAQRNAIWAYGDKEEWIAGNAMSLPGAQDGQQHGASFSGPTGLAIDGSGRYLYVADTGNGSVRLIDTQSLEVTTVSRSFDAPRAIAVGDDRGVLYVAEAKRVLEVSLRDGATQPVIDTASAFLDIRSIAYRAGNLYLADAGDHRVRAIDLATRAVRDVAGTPGRQGVKLGALPGGLNRPSGLGFLPSGELVIADTAENVLLQVAFGPPSPSR